MKHKAVPALVMGLTSGLLFGLATPVSKILVARSSMFQLAGLLYLGAAAACLPHILLHWREEIAFSREQRQLLSVGGVILFGGLLGPIFLLLGLQAAQSSSVSVWLNLELVTTAILGLLFFKEQLDKKAVWGILCVLAAGTASSIHEGLGSLPAAGFVFLACLSWGMDNHLTAIIDRLSPQTVTFIKGLCAGTIHMLLGKLTGGHSFPAETILLILAVGAASYGLSIILYVSSARELGATRAQILFSTSPFWGILAAYLFLGDTVSAYSIAAILLMALGIVLTHTTSHIHAHVHPVMYHAHLHRHDDEHHAHEHPDESANRGLHSHPHRHDETTHTHTHFPDLHHRHDH